MCLRQCMIEKRSILGRPFDRNAGEIAPKNFLEETKCAYKLGSTFDSLTPQMIGF